MGGGVGVLALQGDVREHLRSLADLGVGAFAVRRPDELAACRGLVLPGGESTTMLRLARSTGLLEPLRAYLRAGGSALGTCAGMVLLADRLLDGAPGQETLGGLDVTVRRNAFGRQVDSFEGPVAVAGLADPVHGVFIRAPWVEDAGPDVEVLASVRDHPVAVRQGALLATAFHPELSGPAGGRSPVHALYLDLLG